MTGELVGRDAEVEEGRNFLEAVRVGPTCLILEGNPGIGKTSLWRYLVGAAESTEIIALRSRPTEAESSLSFAALTDLLGPLRDRARRLPPPQRRALNMAMLEDQRVVGHIDGRALGMAVREVLADAATSAPILLAIDDLQWIDVGSARALAFAARRFDQHPIGILATRRPAAAQDRAPFIDQPMAADATTIRRIGPLSLAALHQLIDRRFGLALARPALLHLERASAGNPLLALDVVDALRRSGLEPTADAIMSVPADTGRIVAGRAAVLPTPTRAALMLVAALGRPRIERIEALDPTTDVPALLDPAVAAGLVEWDGSRIGFSHPLYRAAVYSAAGARERREIHLRLAASAQDMEEAALHTALAASEPDHRASEAAAAAAERAFRRGALDAAGDLYAHALRLARSDEHRRPIWLISQARIMWELGDITRSQELLADALSRGPAGRTLAAGLLLQAMHFLWASGAAAARELFLVALTHTEGDVELEAAIHLRIAYGADDDMALGRTHARLATELLERSGVENELRASALLLSAEFKLLSGGGYDPEAVAEGRALLGSAAGMETPGTPFDARAVARERSWLLHAALDDLSEARSELEELRRDDEERGLDRAGPITLCDLAELCCWLGDLRAARAYAHRANELLPQTGSSQYAAAAARLATALVAEHAGDLQTAEAGGMAALELARPLGPGPGLDRAQALLGRLALAADRPAAAAKAFGEIDGRLSAAGVQHSSAARFRSDWIEALARAGRSLDAEIQIERLADLVERDGSRWGRAVLARSRGIVAAAHGDLIVAVREFESALSVHDRLPMPIELGRTWLQLGMVRRRRRQKRSAAAALVEAGTAFRAAGARAWEHRAEVELSRVGGPVASSDALSATEREIARLAASGMTNRQVADALVLSPKSVDGALTRVYAKLGIHSRAELGARMAAGSAARE